MRQELVTASSCFPLFDSSLHSKHDYQGRNSIVEHMKHYAWPDGLRAPTKKSKCEADNE